MWANLQSLAGIDTRAAGKGTSCMGKALFGTAEAAGSTSGSGNISCPSGFFVRPCSRHAAGVKLTWRACELPAGAKASATDRGC